MSKRKVDSKQAGQDKQEAHDEPVQALAVEPVEVAAAHQAMRERRYWLLKEMQRMARDGEDTTLLVQEFMTGHVPDQVEQVQVDEPVEPVDEPVVQMQELEVRDESEEAQEK